MRGSMRNATVYSEEALLIRNDGINDVVILSAFACTVLDYFLDAVPPILYHVALKIKAKRRATVNR